MRVKDTFETKPVSSWEKSLPSWKKTFLLFIKKKIYAKFLRQKIDGIEKTGWEAGVSEKLVITPLGYIRKVMPELKVGILFIIPLSYLLMTSIDGDFTRENDFLFLFPTFLKTNKIIWNFNKSKIVFITIILIVIIH